jgi:hypothetical protein
MALVAQKMVVALVVQKTLMQQKMLVAHVVLRMLMQRMLIKQPILMLRQDKIKAAVASVALVSAVHNFECRLVRNNSAG